MHIEMDIETCNTIECMYSHKLTIFWLSRILHALQRVLFLLDEFKENTKLLRIMKETVSLLFYLLIFVLFSGPYK
jgi:hypothetical protein